MEATEFWTFETWEEKMDGDYWSRDDCAWSSEEQARFAMMNDDPNKEHRLIRVIEIVEVL